MKPPCQVDAQKQTRFFRIENQFARIGPLSLRLSDTPLFDQLPFATSIRHLICNFEPHFWLEIITSRDAKSACFLGNENSARSFSDRSFLNPPRVMDVRAFGSWMSTPKCLFFFQDFEGLTEVLPPDVRRDIRVDVRGISGPKTYSLGCFFDPDFQGSRRHVMR